MSAPRRFDAGKEEHMIHALLTIDDIPSRNTPDIVDFLKEKGIKAILFATGENLERYLAEAQYAVQNGMIVGNHSYSHRAFSALTLEEGIRDIERCEAALDKLYEDSGVPRVFRPLRFPYGDKGGSNKAALQQYLREKQFSKVDDTAIPYPWWRENRLDTDIDTFWTYDFEEYRLHMDADFTPEAVWTKMRDAHPARGAALLGENNRHILLLHAHDETGEKMPGYYKLMVAFLLEQGVVFDEPRFL